MTVLIYFFVLEIISSSVESSGAKLSNFFKMKLLGANATNLLGLLLHGNNGLLFKIASISQSKAKNDFSLYVLLLS